MKLTLQILTSIYWLTLKAGGESNTLLHIGVDIRELTHPGIKQEFHLNNLYKQIQKHKIWDELKPLSSK